MRKLTGLIGLLAVASGCQVGPITTYDVTMEQRQGRMVRSVIREVEWPAGPTSRPDTVEAWAGVYPDRLPDDMGNSGRQIALASDLGVATIYVERFAGNDDQAAVLEARLRSIDRAADLLAGWAKERSPRHKDFAAVGEFFDRDFRRDVKNLAVLNWSRDLSERRMHEGRLGDGPGRGDAILRSSQYLLEHGYVTSETAPVGLQALLQLGSGVSDEAVRRFLGAVVARMGVADPALADQFVSLISGAGGALHEGLADYVRGQPDYQAALAGEIADAADAAGPATRPDDEGLCPTQWLLSLWSPALPLPATGLAWLRWFGPSTQLNLRLKSPNPPVATNGQWADGAVSWQASLDDDIPAVCFAILACPAEGFQRHRFGRVVLSGQGLFEYCLWRAALTEQDRLQWDEFLRGLVPGRDLLARLKAFRFDSQKDTDPAPSIAGLDMIVRALEDP